jgi:hypothetical protein
MFLNIKGGGLEGGDSTDDSSLVASCSKELGEEIDSRNRVLGDLGRGLEGPGTGVISWIGRSEGLEGGVIGEKGGRDSALSESELALWAFFEVEAFGEFVKDLCLFLCRPISLCRALLTTSSRS